MLASKRLLHLAFRFKRALYQRGLLGSSFMQGVAGQTQRFLLGRTFDDEQSFRMKVEDGAVLRVPHGFLTRYLSRPYEPLTVARLRGTLERGMVAVDVGAHIGYLTLLMSRAVGSGGRVYALEPAEENLALLKRNLDENGCRNVSLLEVAAGSERATRFFNVTRSTDCSGFYDHPLTETIERVEVRQVPLDELIEGPVDLVKIDVEGAEMEVLAGMSDILARAPRIALIVEWNPACLTRAGVSPMALPRYLQELGFDLEVLEEGSGAVRSVDELMPLVEADALPLAWHANLMAIRTRARVRGDGTGGR